MYEPLFFSGIRWPGAKVVARRQVVRSSNGWRLSMNDFLSANFPRDPAGDEKKVPFEDTLIIETTGQGRPYSVRDIEAWWRDFAELPLDDEKRVLSFLRRRGDPFGKLASDGTQVSTCDWVSLKVILKCAATAWAPEPDGTGVSRFCPERLSIAKRMFEFSTGYIEGWADHLEVRYFGVDLRLSANLLAAYLCAAAAASVRAGLPMRRCEYCYSWFSVHHAAARQCSASCRAARFKGRTSPHGFISQDQDTQGRDSVAEPMAGAGDERPIAGPVTEFRDAKASEGPRREDARDRKSRRGRPTPA
jgi:hypothetical protein